MPQAHEGRRLFKYRPFITCDDPRGVVECGTIRKHKEEEHQSHRRKHKNLNSVDCISRSANKNLKTKTVFSDPSSEEACDDDSSSSQSSIIHSSNFVSPDSLLSSKASKNKNDDQWRSGWKRRTLDQMIDALKFKGNRKGLHGYLDMKPSRFSCLNMENPIIPKPKGKVDEETILKMRVRTNPLAEIDEFGNLSCSRRRKSDSHLQYLDGEKSVILNRKSSRRDTNTKINMLQTLLRQDVEENGVDEIEKVNSIGERESQLPFDDWTRLDEDASQIEITDYVGDDQSSPSETPLIYLDEHDTNTKVHDKESQCSTSDTSNVEEEEDYVHVTSTLSTNENKLKALLLSSSSFINRVEKLFDLKANPVKDLLNDIDHNDLNAKMLLDSANELVELYGYECSRAYKTSSVSCYYTCLDQLLDEVCNGIEALRFYIQGEEGGYVTDNLLLLVKGDLRNGKMVTGVWDIGWRKSGSAEEIEEITRGVDELVLDGLIQELVDDLTI